MIAGDIGAIRRYAPADLKRKTIVVEYANEEDVQDLRKRGASIRRDDDAVAWTAPKAWANGRRQSSRPYWWRCAPIPIRP